MLYTSGPAETGRMGGLGRPGGTPGLGGTGEPGSYAHLILHKQRKKR